jgi:hypothetical protein
LAPDGKVEGGHPDFVEQGRTKNLVSEFDVANDFETDAE